MTPQRIQLRRTKGWRIPPNTVVASRPGPLGNPFITGTHGTRLACVGLYTIMLAHSSTCCAGGPTIEAQTAHLDYLAANRTALRGKNLACWCSLPKPGEPDICHAAIQLAIINLPKEQAAIHCAGIINAYYATNPRHHIFIGHPPARVEAGI